MCGYYILDLESFHFCQNQNGRLRKLKHQFVVLSDKMLAVYMICKLVLQLFQFLEIISSPSRAQGLPVDSTIVLKEGWVM